MDPSKSILYEKYFNLSLKFLSYRPRSEKELNNYLTRKKLESFLISQIICQLKKLKFVNDVEFAQWWVEQRTLFRPTGKEQIKRELLQKGISKETIEKVLANYSSKSELAQAKKLIDKKKHLYKGLNKQELFQKAGGLLSRRGFSYSIIKTCIDELLQEGV